MTGYPASLCSRLSNFFRISNNERAKQRAPGSNSSDNRQLLVCYVMQCTSTKMYMLYQSMNRRTDGWTDGNGERNRIKFGAFKRRMVWAGGGGGSDGGQRTNEQARTNERSENNKLPHLALAQNSQNKTKLGMYYVRLERNRTNLLGQKRRILRRHFNFKARKIHTLFSWNSE